MSQPLVVITGASSGIGLATARAFAAVNHPLLLISRNIEPTAELSDKPVDYARADCPITTPCSALFARANRGSGIPIV